MIDPIKGTLQDRYNELVPDRDPYLRRARACAAITVQAVMPPEGHSASSVLPQTHTSFGARATINLASKTSLSLLPPGDSSFTLNVPVKTLMEEGVLTAPPEIVKGLAQCELLVNSKIESLQWRRPTFLTILHLIVAGNICEYILPDGRVKQFRLDQFVCVRDFSGKVIEIVACERMRVVALAEDLRSSTNKKPEEDCNLYTRFRLLPDNRYTTQQDLDEVTVNAEQTHSGIMPANALAWNLVPGETYGRSHVEDNFADLTALEDLSRNIREMGAMASKHLTFVRPNAAGGNLRKRIAESRNGAVLSGNHEDVEAFQFNVSASLSELRAEKESVKRDLAQAFLMTGDLRRDAERVTAYELRMLVQEIESALGGTYSLLSTELQAWRIKKLIAQMRSRKELPDLGESVDIVVTTGLEALGRDEKLNRVRSFLGLIAEAKQAGEDVALYVKFDEVLTPGAIALGFPQAIRTQAEVDKRQQEQQQQQMAAQMATAAAGPVANAMVSPAQPTSQ